MRRTFVRWLAVSSFCTAAVAGCGDDDDAPDASGGKAATGGQSTTGGKSVSEGGTSSGGSPNAGAPQGEAGENSSTSGGAGGAGEPGTTGGTTTGGTTSTTGGAGAGGEAPIAEAGAGGVPVVSNDVHGTVIDVYGHKVANVPVTLGSTTVSTDAQGRFHFEDAPEQYDVWLQFGQEIGGGNDYTWIYQGLTRRNPTLQVRTAVPAQNARVALNITGGSYETNEVTSVGVGSPDGTDVWEGLDYTAGTAKTQYFDWRGPTTTTARVHALRWTKDAQNRPTAYQAYASALQALDSADTEPPTLSLSLPDSTVEAHPISGSVTSSSTTNRNDFVFLRFTSNAAIPLYENYSATGEFSHTIPRIPDSVVTLVARQGQANTTQQSSLVWKDVVAGQDSDIDLVIPAPPQQTSPAVDATGVNATTKFSWTQTAKVYLLHVVWDGGYGEVVIVTDKPETSIPNLGGAFPLKGKPRCCSWRTEVHTSAANVDAATGPDGFIDPFIDTDFDWPRGNKRGAGSLAVSSFRSFTPQAD